MIFEPSNHGKVDRIMIITGELSAEERDKFSEELRAVVVESVLRMGKEASWEASLAEKLVSVETIFWI